MKLSCLLLALFLTTPARAEREIGNGGARVRTYFFDHGRRVVRYLRSTQAGRTLTQRFSLSPDRLEAVLREEVVLVVAGPLIDNRGSQVDAIGVPGSIRLDKKIWLEYLERDLRLHRLVFHEMLRAADVNDDDDRISRFVSALDGNGATQDPSFAEARNEFQTAEFLGGSLAVISNYEWDCVSVRTDGVKSVFGMAVWAGDPLEMTFENLGSPIDYQIGYDVLDFYRVNRSEGRIKQLWIEQTVERILDPHLPASISASGALGVRRFVRCAPRE